MQCDVPDLGTDQEKCKEFRKERNEAYNEGRGYPITTLSFIYEQWEDYSKQENVRKNFPKKTVCLGNSIMLGKTLARNKSVLVLNINLLLLF